jgi:hypothetical protein
MYQGAPKASSGQGGSMARSDSGLAGDRLTIPVARARVPAGQITRKPVVIGPGGLRELLPDVVRRVADLPPGTTPVVVWHLSQAELAVDTAGTALGLRDGIVVVTVSVTCDELGAWVPVEIPLAVGGQDAPAGLVMAAGDRIHGPDLVADLWSDALTAYAWETVLELARTVCAKAGRDTKGRPLVPGSVTALPDRLVVQPMGRNDIPTLDFGRR